MLKILGFLLLFSLVLACLVLMLENWAYTLIGIAAIWVLFKIKNAVFPKKVPVESEEEKRERELARKEVLMEQFHELERRAESQKCLNCSLEELADLKELAGLGYVPAMMLLATHKLGSISYEYCMLATEVGEYQGAVYAYWRFLDMFFDRPPVPSNYSIKTICEGLRKGAESGNVDCMFALSQCYADGWIQDGAGLARQRYHSSPYEPSPEKMFFWLKKAYDMGCTNPGVQVLMAEYYATGKIWIDYYFNKDPVYISKGDSINQKKAFELIEAVMQSDWPERTLLSPAPTDGWRYIARKYLLTMFYFDGYGTKQDTKKAKEIFRPRTVDEEDALNDEADTLTVITEDKVILSALREELKEAYIKELKNR